MTNFFLFVLFQHYPPTRNISRISILQCIDTAKKCDAVCSEMKKIGEEKVMCFRPPTVDAGPIKCPQCGAEVDPKLDQCPSCGAKAAPVATPPGVPVPPPVPGVPGASSVPSVPKAPSAPQPPAPNA